MLSELSEEIHIVGQAQDASAAMVAVRELHPDVVILDIQMPGGSGLDVLQAIKEDRADTIVMILTNYPYPQYRQKCLEGGAAFFFDKSTEFEQVPAVFRQLIRESRIRSGLSP